jgi:hypothetical protein
MTAMQDELTRLFRAIYSDRVNTARNHAKAFDAAVKLVKRYGPDLSEREARKLAAEALAVEPEADYGRSPLRSSPEVGCARRSSG